MTVEVFLIGALAEAKDFNPREIYEQTSPSVVNTIRMTLSVSREVEATWDSMITEMRGRMKGE